MRFILGIGLCVLLSGCANIANHGAQLRQKQNLASAKTYLQLANSTQGITQQRYLLKAARRLVDDQHIVQAQSVLNRMQGDSVDSTVSTEKQLLQTRLLMANHQYQRAQQTLQQLVSTQTQQTPQQMVDYYQLQAQIFQAQKKIIPSIEERNKLNAYLSTPAQKKQNLIKIWETLQNLSPTELNQLDQQSQSVNLRGWFQLARIADQHYPSAGELIDAIGQWRRQYPGHPASELLPKKWQQSQTLLNQAMHKITLLLPLTGPFSQQAKAIRQGFITAFYRARGLASAKEGLADSIQVVNTNQQNINQLYQQAVAQGSNIIVGPLTKQHLTQLIQHTTLSVPTLALNSLPIEKPIRHLYLFGLSPFDGAQQAAIKAWRSHHTRAIVIAPDSTWGRNISDVFQQQWQQLGGRVINTIDYGKEASLAQKIEKGLNVNQSYQRYRELRRILGYQRIRFVPRRRKDFNVVFMVATPHMARMIKPLLNYYYAQTIPAYALSQIYQGTPDPKRDHDLNGIIFCDMPWVLQAQHMQPGYLNTLQKRIETLWAANYRNYAKLYALGVDAFDVIGKLNKMTLLPQFGVEGATGTLYLDQRHHLFRQLVWAKMVNGKPKLLNNINRIT